MSLICWLSHVFNPCRSYCFFPRESFFVTTRIPQVLCTFLHSGASLKALLKYTLWLDCAIPHFTFDWLVYYLPFSIELFQSVFAQNQYRSNRNSENTKTFTQYWISSDQFVYLCLFRYWYVILALLLLHEKWTGINYVLMLVFAINWTTDDCSSCCGSGASLSR